METKRYWKDKLAKTIIYAVIAFVCTLSLFLGLEQSPFLAIIIALSFSGIPAGWSITKGIFGGWVVIGFWGIMLLIIRVMLSLVIGIFALPIQILMYVANYKNAPEDSESGSETDSV